MKLGRCLEIMKVLLSLLVLLYKYVISFLPKIQAFTKETKIAVAVAYNYWQLWKKVFEKFKPNPWKKTLEEFFFSNVAGKAPANLPTN